MRTLYDNVQNTTDSDAQKPGFHGLTRMGIVNYRLWGGEAGKRISESMQTDYPNRDTFFVSSAAYDGGVSERTLRNYLAANPLSLNFVDRLPYGGIATCSRSMRAWSAVRVENDGRKKVGTWRANFVRDVNLTEVGGGSVIGVVNNNEKE